MNLFNFSKKTWLNSPVVGVSEGYFRPKIDMLPSFGRVNSLLCTPDEW